MFLLRHDIQIVMYIMNNLTVAVPFGSVLQFQLPTQMYANITFYYIWKLQFVQFTTSISSPCKLLNCNYTICQRDHVASLALCMYVCVLWLKSKLDCVKWYVTYSANQSQGQLGQTNANDEQHRTAYQNECGPCKKQPDRCCS